MRCRNDFGLVQDAQLRVRPFIRTTEADHIALVQKMLNQLWEKSKQQEARGELPDLYAKDYEGLYYVPMRFLSPRRKPRRSARETDAEITSIREKELFLSNERISTTVDRLY